MQVQAVPAREPRCALTSHTHQHTQIATERREPGLQLGRAGRRPPPLSEHLVCVLNLQESCILAKTAFILIFNFIFFGAKNRFYYVKTVLSCHILRSRKGEVFRKGGPSTAPRHRASGLAQIGGILAIHGPRALRCLSSPPEGRRPVCTHTAMVLSAPQWRRSKATPSIRGPGSLLCAPHLLLQSPHQAWEADAVTPFPRQPLKFMWGEARCDIPFY